jgi:hypothetical protein
VHEIAPVVGLGPVTLISEEASDDYVRSHLRGSAVPLSVGNTVSSTGKLLYYHTVWLESVFRSCLGLFCPLLCSFLGVILIQVVE